MAQWRPRRSGRESRVTFFLRCLDVDLDAVLYRSLLGTQDIRTARSSEYLDDLDA